MYFGDDLHRVSCVCLALFENSFYFIIIIIIKGYYYNLKNEKWKIFRIYQNIKNVLLIGVCKVDKVAPLETCTSHN